MRPWNMANNIMACSEHVPLMFQTRSVLYDRACVLHVQLHLLRLNTDMRVHLLTVGTPDAVSFA